MNGNHLPAGQPMPGGVGGAPSGPGLNGGRRRPPPSYSAHHPIYQHHTQHQQHAAMMYPNSYMNPYANAYYPPHQMAHHYQTGHMPNPHYPVSYTYQQRSQMPVHQTYPAIVSSTMQAPPQPWAPRPPPQQPSPALSTPPPLSSSGPPPSGSQTPPSTRSSQAAATPLSPTAPETQAVTSEIQEAVSSPQESEVPVPSTTFRYPLPWLSVPDEPFPSATKSRRRRRHMDTSTSVELPMAKQNGVQPDQDAKVPSSNDPIIPDKETTTAVSPPVNLSPEALANSLPREEHEQSTSPEQASAQTAPSTTPTPTKTNKPTTRATVPAVPAIPVIPTPPKSTHKEADSSSDSQTPAAALSGAGQPHGSSQTSTETALTGPAVEPHTQTTADSKKLWSNLFSTQKPSIASSNGPNNLGTATTAPGAISSDATNASNGHPGPGSFAKSNASSLAEALRDYQVSNDHKIAFLEPRGLVNTGNMCYMNSVLQALIFCTPFYDFLDQVSKKSAYSFNSETPLIDAMVMFLREYKVIDSAISVTQLRRRLKSEELEQYGDAFIPEFVYEAMKRLPRFATMQRGHQQDAEEFLGFLLQALGDECSLVMRRLDESSAAADPSSAASTNPSSPTNATNGTEWLEVGRKQKPAITRSSGHSTSSPISKVFSGQIRSVLRVPGQKDSVTFETYQTIQLDIGGAHVNNVVDALKYYTRSEKLNGDFGSTRPDSTTTKQVLIESIPPVLILHLKRFQYDPKDNSTSKLWSKIDYPLELELPKEIFSPPKRTAILAEGHGFPKYRLTAAIYHHGKSASGGHYTVDLRRQDDQEWIRVDDTVIRRIRSEDVAGSEIDGAMTKVATKVDQKHSVIGPASGNRFEGIGDDDAGDEEGWSKVSTAGAGAKKWSSVAKSNGSSNAMTSKHNLAKDNIKDNKVAYLLFYQKI